jgi:adenylate cyclase
VAPDRGAGELANLRRPVCHCGGRVRRLYVVVRARPLTGRRSPGRPAHRPRREERIFLFGDLQRSTGIAERLGELRYHAFLNRVFVDAARPVEEYNGLIYQYVGDQMVVTWPLERGLADWNCLHCAGAINDALLEARDRYESEFGATPRFRFAVHCGPVVAGELGGARREIVFSGDTLNTVARIEGLAKEAEREFVVSEDVLRRAPLPDGLTAESLGVHTLPGKQRPLELFALRLHIVDRDRRRGRFMTALRKRAN